MGKFIIKRIIWIPISLLLVSAICFFLSKAVPYDPVDYLLQYEQGDAGILGEDQFREEEYFAAAKKLALNKPPFYISLSASNSQIPSETLLIPSQRKSVELLLKKGFEINDALSKKELSIDQIRLLPDQFRISLPFASWHGFDNQFHIWIKKILRGDWGISYLDGRPVLEKILEALNWTLFMVIIAIFLSFALGIGLGLFSVLSKKRWLVRIIEYFNYFIYAMPLFCLATMALIFLTSDDYGSWTNIFPGPSVIMGQETGFWNQIITYGSILILPIFILSIYSLSYISRQMETSLNEEHKKSYIRTALTKGLSKTNATTNHAFRNALLPIITLFTSALPASIGGSVIVETVFNIPGMGRLLFDSIVLADWNVVFLIVLITALVTALSFLLADVLYFALNPKMKHSIADS